ncbi:MAG: hypothetical protein RR396_01080 [Clostridiales bacterium]
MQEPIAWVDKDLNNEKIVKEKVKLTAENNNHNAKKEGLGGNAKR